MGMRRRRGADPRVLDVPAEDPARTVSAVAVLVAVPFAWRPLIDPGRRSRCGPVVRPTWGSEIRANEAVPPGERRSACCVRIMLDHALSGWCTENRAGCSPTGASMHPNDRRIAGFGRVHSLQCRVHSLQCSVLQLIELSDGLGWSVSLPRTALPCFLCTGRRVGPCGPNQVRGLSAVTAGQSRSHGSTSLVGANLASQSGSAAETAPPLTLPGTRRRIKWTYLSVWTT